MATTMKTLTFKQPLNIEGAKWPHQFVFTMKGFRGDNEGNGNRVALIAEPSIITKHARPQVERTTVSVGETVRVEGYGSWRIENPRPGFCDGDSCRFVPVDATAKRHAAAVR